MAERKLYPYTPEYAFPPGSMLREALDDRNLSVADLADRSGLAASELGLLLEGRQELTAQTARALQTALGISANLWLGLERQYREFIAVQAAPKASRPTKRTRRQERPGGMVHVLVLSELARGDNYGYGIVRAIEDRSSGELVLRPENLYPVLHRMLDDGLLVSRWVQAENGRPRKIYGLTPLGRKLWAQERREFIQHSSAALKALTGTGTPRAAPAVRPA